VTNYLGPYTVTPIGTSQRRRRIAGRSLSGVPIVSLIRIPLAASRCDRQRGNPVVRLSAHIQREMQGRGITQAYIEEVLANPTYTAPDPTDPTLTRSFGPLPAFGNRMLRVVHRPDGSDVFVVTATWDRGATP
jgi:hypothetical protein